MDNQLIKQVQNINCLVSEIDCLYHQISLKLGLSDSKSRILYTLYINGNACPISKIYKQSGIKKQTVNSALRKLEMEEIVALEQIDGRAKLVKFTDKGREYAKNTIAKLVDKELNAYKCFDEDQIKQYLALNEKFMNALKNELDNMQEEDSK